MGARLLLLLYIYKSKELGRTKLEESISERKARDQREKAQALERLSEEEIQAGNEMLKRFAASPAGKRLKPSGRRAYNYDEDCFY